ncbi:conserved protein of unknown function [Sterolibacterium denitrificans]|uniref:MoaB/Mog domain-containing protein n=1 Tax=Sterolibacterium denitrificans TaxID=157592 RepID=A0A7Z7MVK7_9PROT|nr:molybdopterin-binding/glycosyltransferase family 2 protein [Sterolibacterium denitrificans]SMB26055.1 conserved protein of unknown function [Sterolibacterium denitrificans]
MPPPASQPDPFLFGEFPVAEAVGILLAHSLNLRPTDDGTPALRLRKGHLLTAGDVAMLQAAGIATVSGARLGPEVIAENPAAASVAALLAGPHSAPRTAVGGRCNLHATQAGILVVDGERVIRANLLAETVAIGTLPPWSQVRKGQVIATVKIVPAAIARRTLAACSEILAVPPLRVAPLHPRRAALIVTQLPEQRAPSPAAIIEVTRQRLASLHSRLALELHCRHTEPAIAAAIRQAKAAGCDLILISGAAGTKDRRDLVPRAIIAAGGRIERFGMPVEPGNMLLLARLGELPLLVLPGCARSRRLNGLDWVLQRLIANLPLDAEAIASMGVGGLIRQQPGAFRDSLSDTAGNPADTESPLPRLPMAARRPQPPRVAALILAAGTSQRMGEQHKLLAEIDGIPLVLRAVNAALASNASSVTLITGKCGEEIAALAGGDNPRLTRVHNPDYAAGMASSLCLGIRSLPDDAEAVLVLLADMPHVNAAHLDRLIEAYGQYLERAPIIVPLHAGRRGNPALWPRRFFPQILTLTGDQGARSLLQQHHHEVITLDMNDPAVLMDIDTPQDLASLKNHPGVSPDPGYKEKRDTP